MVAEAVRDKVLKNFLVAEVTRIFLGGGFRSLIIVVTRKHRLIIKRVR